MHKRQGPRRLRSLALGVFAVLLAGQAWSASVALGQAQVDPIVGLDFDFEEGLLDEPWVDPIEQFELVDEPLAPVPEFDLAELHPSAVFEEGVERQRVQPEVDVAVESDQYLRALQAVATAEQALQVAGEDIVAAEQAIVAATDRIAAARKEIVALEAELDELEIERSEIIDADNAEIAELERLHSEIAKNEDAIVELAIQAFIGSDDALAEVALDPLSIEPIARKIVTDEVRDSQRANIAALEALVAEAEERRRVLADERQQVEAAIAERQDDIAARVAEIGGLRDDIINLRAAIVSLEAREVVLGTTIEEAVAFTEVTKARFQIKFHERLPAFVAGTDLPLVALNAYVRASRTLAVEDPSCGIHWSQLAGIGRIESLHGHFGDSTLDINGHTTVDIRGLALDGRVLSGATSNDLPDATGRTEQTGSVSRLALIRDTDDGRLDGDTVYDRAVGPMQFIPSTWRLYDSDGNADGDIDPQNIYDASLASARYLCAATGSMLTAEGEQRAYFAYNHDLTYSRNVTLAGRRYHNDLQISPEASPRFAAYAASGAAEALAQQAIADAAAENEETDESEVDGETDADGDIDPDAEATPDSDAQPDVAPEVLASTEDN